MYFAYYTLTTKLRFASWSCGSVLCVLQSYYKVAIGELELRKCTLRITVVLQSCDWRAGAAEVYFAYYTRTTKLRFSSWSCGSVLCVLHSYYKVEICELELRKCTLRTTLLLQSCDWRAGAAEVYFAYYSRTTKLRFASWSCGSVLCVLHSYYKVEICELELRKCTLRTTVVLQSCDFRAGAAEVYFAYYTLTTKLRFASWSCGSVLCVLHSYYKVAIFELELRKCTLRTTLLLQSCDFRAGAAEVYFAYYSRATKLRFASWSCGSVLCVLHSYYKVEICELELRKCTLRTTVVLQSCDFQAGPAPFVSPLSCSSASNVLFYCMLSVSAFHRGC